MKTIKMILGIAVVATLSTSVYGACTSQVHMSGNKIIGLGDPIYAQDAATKKYVDAKVAVARAAIEAEKERKRKEDLIPPTGYKIIKYGGKAWLDRNLGATASPTSFSDTNPATFGWLFQWGRPADRHQYRNSSTTFECSTKDAPGHPYFIKANSGYGAIEVKGPRLSGGFNWRTTSSNCKTDARKTHFWSVSGSAYNGVCPAGWRVPSKEDFRELNLKSGRDAFEKIKLSAAGWRSFFDSIENVGSQGNYWTSSVVAGGSYFIHTTPRIISFFLNHRAEGLSVRCIK
jgi:uncharacterized protein (TIGR02145 family)